MALAPLTDTQDETAVDIRAEAASFNRADMLERTLAHQIEAIRMADLKMALLVPTTSAMAGVLAALYRGARDSVLTSTAFMVALVPMVAVLLIMAFTVLPRLRFGGGQSTLFFGDISEDAPDTFARNLTTLSAEAYYDDLARQCHATARIARVKYRMVHRAYLAFLVAVPLWTVALFLLSINRSL